MQVIGGIVTLLNCVLSVVIGVRLLRLGRRSQGPEAWLGVYFLFAAFLGSILSSTVYMSWADASLRLPPALLASLHALHLCCASFGLFGIWVFTQRVFRADSIAARRVVAAAAVTFAVSIVGLGVMERFEVRVVNGPLYWINFATREAAMVWMAVESWLYFVQLRRRLRLGLADPLLTNRFLLWGVWAGAMSLLLLVDPLARLWYWSLTGTTTHWVPAIGMPIIVATIAVASALGAITAVTVLLTFFPVPAYRRWVVARAPAAASR